MKIAINNKILDTKDIFCIHEIYTTDWYSTNYIEINKVHILFKIECYNDKHFLVKLNTELNNKEDNIELYNTKLKEVINFRNELIKVWSENQIDIPKYTLNNSEIE